MGSIPGGRLKLRFHAEGRLPVNYREGLQAALYQALPPSLGQRLHDQGAVEGPRPLKLFVFSRLLGLRYLREERAFQAEGELVLYFASALAEVVGALGQGVWERGGLEVHGVFLRFLGLDLEPLPVGGVLEVEALAPITVYRTEGERTVYFNPLNREFALLLEANLNRKAQALGLSPGRLAVRPLGFRTRNKRVERYKGTWVEGWMGRYRLEGTPHLLRLALLAGLGAKNSQGFGFVREVEEC
ncbi:CRISPR-associated endoribonuclease Cas6 [Thermus filiformis]|uniref:CRISPR-associated endoribonuclease n=1 Tax=Thermus filiformis TaxID=276 RepID=A0A0A2WX61_THEFI|nr:CRISPR-associated endoribonuclease Cas6 [Thermus filiformis]KGQ22885.2 CRISPR-associated protein Cas6 [Thermus filiformis]